MSTAAFSAPHDPQRRISLKRRRGDPTTPTSAAADDAIRQFVESRRRRNEYGAEQPSEPTFIDGLVDVTADAGRSLFRQFGLVLVPIAAAVVAVAAYSAWEFVSQEPRYTIAGRATISGQPLGRVTLVFHGLDAPGEPFTQAVFTGLDGEFRNDPTVGIPAGTYAVVVSGAVAPLGGRRGKSTAIPDTYRNPTTTPLRATVAGNTEGLELAVTP